MTITCNYITHKNKEWILLKSEYNAQLNKIFRTLNFIKFSNTHKSWYLPKNKELLQQVIEKTKAIATINTQLLKVTIAQQAQKTTQKLQVVKQGRISEYNINEFQKYLQMLTLKGYSPNTVNTYKNEFSVYLQTLGQVNANTLTTQRVKDYLQYCFDKLKLTESTIHSRMNALKFYYEQVLKRDKFFWEIPRPKKRLILPKVISEEKILQYLFTVENIKHRTILLIAYSAGLRVSEVVNLKTTDIDTDRMQIFIQNAKGKKDRIVPLSKTIKALLDVYRQEFNPQNWLFEGQTKELAYSVRSAQIIFREACMQLKLPKNVGFHSLRHSYATHLLDNGTDVKYIQQLLGHNDIKTTLRYLHVTNKDVKKIESPLDKIAQKANKI